MRREVIYLTASGVVYFIILMFKEFHVIDGIRGKIIEKTM